MRLAHQLLVRLPPDRMDRVEYTRSVVPTPQDRTMLRIRFCTRTTSLLLDNPIIPIGLGGRHFFFLLDDGSPPHSAEWLSGRTFS